MKKRRRERDTKEVSIADELKHHLEIDKHSLDTELQQQASTFFKISEAFVKAVAFRDYCKEEIKRVDADLSAHYRRKLEKSGARPTDAAVTASIAADDKHQKAVDRHLKSSFEADLLGALKEAFHQRSFMVRDLASLYLASYYEKDSVNGSQGREIKANKNIDRMAEERKRRKEKE